MILLAYATGMAVLLLLSIHNGISGFWALVMVLAGLYVADVLTGIAHFLLDYLPCRKGIGFDRLYFYPGAKSSEEYARLREQVMRKANVYDRLVFDFKIHHPAPDNLARQGFYNLVVPAVSLAGLPAVILLLLTGYILELSGAFLLFMWTVILATNFSQVLHVGAHMKSRPDWLKWMQRLRLVIAPETHAGHHQSPDCDFCIVNGWANPLVNLMFGCVHRLGWLTEEGLEPRG